MQPERGEDQRLTDRDEPDRGPQHGPVAVRDPVRDVQEPQPEREAECKRGERGVGHHLEDPMPVDGITEAVHEGPECRASSAVEFGPRPAAQCGLHLDGGPSIAVRDDALSCASCS
jgi:hypothetical protein